MANCPLTGDPCPEHNKAGGCSWWMDYTGNKNTMETKFSGCAIVVGPMLTMENINMTGLVAGEVNKAGAEISAGRVENIKEGDAIRRQFVALALGHTEVIKPNYLKITEGN